MSTADRQAHRSNLKALAAQLSGSNGMSLAALAQADQRSRWEKGDRLLAEAYLEQLPALGADIDGQLDLIYGEVVLREEQGEHPILEEYLARFPQHSVALRRQFALHGAVREQLNSRFTSNETLSAEDKRDTPAAEPPPGRKPDAMPKQFGRYRVVKVLGRGGMGAVYLAHDTELDRPVALKVPHFARSGSAGARERFIREARAAAALSHPNICPVYDVGAIDSVPYLTMAYIEGRPLSDLVRGGPLPLDQAAALVRQMALALDEAHQRGVIHRDLKPSNVMLNRRDEPVIMDFGLARLTGSGDARLTADGQMLGTPAYMPPEQVNGELDAMGPGCDVYSLGAILYELLTGRQPFQGSMAKVLAQVLTDDPVAMKDLRPDIPPALDAICRKAMAKKTEDRFPRMSDFARVLGEYLKGAVPNDAPTTITMQRPSHETDRHKVPDTASISAARPPRRAVPAIAVAALLLVGAGVVGFVFLGRGSPDKETSASTSSVPAPTSRPVPETKVAAANDPAKLARQAQVILETNCARCHGKDGSAEGGFASVLDVQRMIATKKIMPGNAAGSKLFKKVKGDEMPPEEEKPRPSKADLDVLAAWIDAGAPAFPVETAKARPFLGTKDILTAIRDHLRKAPREDRRFQRYFTFTLAHNNPKVTDADLRLYRAGLSKLLNSLSWKNAIVVPETIDANQTVLVVDLRKLDWDRHDLWRELLKGYPYGLKHDRDRDDAVRDMAVEIYELAGTELPYVRADWFVAVAGRPPLVHVLLRLPKHARELERTLKVDVYDNFLRDRLARAGFASSGISGQNRLVERHDSVYGTYWKSYDFRSNEGTGNLFRYPLGPSFADNPYDRLAFRHDGGEIVFSLPNGLNGYLLVNGKDERIDEGPIEVVSDSLKTSGTAKIVNGLSCIACHVQGIQSNFKDTVRNGTPLKGDPLDKLRKLYPKPEEMGRLLQLDTDRFLAAQEKAMGPFLHVGPDKDKVVKDFAEPVGLLARQYILKELTVEDAARELGLPGPQALIAAIKANERLRQMGLGPLASGATIKRETWAALDGFVSPYQEVAGCLELGTPIRIK